PSSWGMNFGFGKVGFGLAGTTIPQLASATGEGVLTLSQIMPTLETMMSLINVILSFLETFEGVGGGWDLSDYIYIDDSGDLVFRADSGAWILNLNDLGIASNKNFGLMLASAAARLYWYDKGGTLDHVFCPETTAHGKLGDSSFKWLETHSKKAYHDTRLVEPVGPNMFD
ncbi:hypothetical protein LCGC14_2003720, partial [marine sediment metagenome]